MRSSQGRPAKIPYTILLGYGTTERVPDIVAATNSGRPILCGSSTGPSYPNTIGRTGILPAAWGSVIGDYPTLYRATGQRKAALLRTQKEVGFRAERTYETGIRASHSVSHNHFSSLWGNSEGVSEYGSCLNGCAEEKGPQTAAEKVSAKPMPPINDRAILRRRIRLLNTDDRYVALPPVKSLPLPAGSYTGAGETTT